MMGIRYVKVPPTTWVMQYREGKIVFEGEPKRLSKARTPTGKYFAASERMRRTALPVPPLVLQEKVAYPSGP